MGLFGADGYIFPPIGDLCAMIDFLCGMQSNGQNGHCVSWRSDLKKMSVMREGDFKELLG